MRIRDAGTNTGSSRAPAGLVVWCLLAALASSLGDRAQASSDGRGEGLFWGREPLAGAVRGHQTRLPPEVVRCRNCHTQGGQAARKGTAAPKLDRALLLEARPRRGGPPSSYDRDTFCKLLRTGVDPAFVLIAREMPVYEITDAQCGHLWRFLTEH